MIGVCLHIAIIFVGENRACTTRARESRPTATAPAPHSVDFYYYGFVAKGEQSFGIVIQNR